MGAFSDNTPMLPPTGRLPKPWLGIDPLAIRATTTLCRLAFLTNVLKKKQPEFICNYAQLGVVYSSDFDVDLSRYWMELLQVIHA